MKRFFLFACLMAAACATNLPAPPEPPAPLPPAATGADGAGNRLEALEGAHGRLCSADGQWCVAAGADQPIAITRQSQSYGIEARERAEAAPWPYAVRLADGAALLGVLWTTTDGYSGGGAAQTELTLYHISEGRAAPALELLVAGDALIRACFSEENVRERAGACHDDYRFSATLSLDEANASAGPSLIYETQAVTFPGQVSRTASLIERGPLDADDLVWTRDENCTMRRVFAWDGAAFAPDAPAPACEDYRTL